LPEAVVVHVSRGRVRLRIPARKHDAAFFSDLERRLAPLPGVEKVEVNPVTASVLVLHRLNLTSREDFAALATSSPLSGLLTLTPPQINRVANPAGSISLGQSWAMSLARLNDRMRSSTEGLVDVPTLGVVALVAVGIRQMRQGALFMPAMTALWYASFLLKDQLPQDGQSREQPLGQRG
jgi:hypothetical protein